MEFSYILVYSHRAQYSRDVRLSNDSVDFISTPQVCNMSAGSHVMTDIWEHVSNTRQPVEAMLRHVVCGRASLFLI